MGIIRRSRTRKKPRFDYKRWVDYDSLVAGAHAIRSGMSIFTIPRKRIQSQSLEHVMQNLHLTEKDIQDRKRVFLQIALLMLFLTGCLLSYSIYLIFHQHLSGAAVSVALMFITLGLCFRYHFWYFQLKTGKLGCTFMEWLKTGVIGLKQ